MTSSGRTPDGHCLDVQGCRISVSFLQALPCRRPERSWGSGLIENSQWALLLLLVHLLGRT